MILNHLFRIIYKCITDGYQQRLKRLLFWKNAVTLGQRVKHSWSAEQKFDKGIHSLIWK